MKVEVLEANIADKSVIQHLYPLYLHDLSEFVNDLEVNEWGLFDIEVSDLFWEEDLLFPFLIRTDEKLAGFALIATPPYTSPEVDYLMNEFFVLKKYRHRGVGRLAAFELLNRFQGRWEVCEAPKNILAQAFWHRIIGEYTSGKYENLDGGTKQRFRN